MAVRTSQTHPIFVAWLTENVSPSGRRKGAEDTAGSGGAVGVTFAPGKTGPSVLGDPWDRDLLTDLTALRQSERVDVLISLVEEHELTLLQIESLPTLARSVGLTFHHFPVVDMRTPSLALARRAAQSATSAAQAGQRVVFHCRGGLGRAGTLAACTLIHLGHAAAGAILRTRAVRPGAIETAAQEAFVRAYTP